MTNRTINVPAGQTSPVFMASAGGRVAVTGTGTLQYTLSPLVDINNNLAVWVNSGVTLPGYDDAVVSLYCRVIATTYVVITISDGDTALDGQIAKNGVYWQSQSLNADQAAAVAPVVLAAGTAAASANTAAIQAALDAAATAGGGTVKTPPGQYYINATLRPSSNTTIDLIGTELIAVPVSAGGPTFNMFRNTNAMSTPIAVTGVTAVAFGHYLVRCTVSTSSAHGLVVGGYAQIKGDGAGIYNGIWLVETVPSSTTYTFVMTIAAGSTNAPPSTAAAVASASQTVATPGVFTTASNTFTAGQAVTITGTPPTGFANGTVYYVIANGLTTTTVQLADSPYATTGKQVTASSACTLSPVYYTAAADGNITIRGGKINCNFVGGGFTEQSTYLDHAIIMRRVLNLSLESLRYYDVRKYAQMLQDTVSPKVRNIDGVSGSDCTHIYGPCFDPVVEVVTGSWGDDVVPIQTIDGSGYLPYMLGSGFDCGGDIWNGTFKDIRPIHTHNSGGVVLYPNGNSGGAGATAEIYRIRGTQTVYGASARDPYVSANWIGGNPVAIGNGYVGVVGQIENLVCHGTPLPLMDNAAISVLITVQNMTLNNPTTDQFAGITTTLNYAKYVTVNNLVINNPTVLSKGAAGTSWLTPNGANATFHNIAVFGGYFKQAAAGDLTAIYLVGASNVPKVTFYGTRFEGASGQNVYGVASNGSGVLGTAEFVGCKFDAYSRAFTNDRGQFSGTPKVVVSGGSASANYSCLADCGSTQNLNIHVRDFVGASSAVGVFNFYGSGVINMYVSGLEYSGTLFANSTGTLSMYNPDGSCPIALSALSRTAAGQMAKAATSLGTIVANNLCVNDATGAANSWKQLSNTTLVY